MTTTSAKQECCAYCLGDHDACIDFSCDCHDAKPTTPTQESWEEIKKEVAEITTVMLGEGKQFKELSPLVMYVQKKEKAAREAMRRECEAKHGTK